MNGERRNAFVLTGKGPLGRSRCSWMDNFKFDLREIG
jgi:hypothetical protein